MAISSAAKSVTSSTLPQSVALPSDRIQNSTRSILTLRPLFHLKMLSLLKTNTQLSDHSSTHNTTTTITSSPTWLQSPSLSSLQIVSIGKQQITTSSPSHQQQPQSLHDTSSPIVTSNPSLRVSSPKTPRKWDLRVCAKKSQQQQQQQQLHPALAITVYLTSTKIRDIDPQRVKRYARALGTSVATSVSNVTKTLCEIERVSGVINAFKKKTRRDWDVQAELVKVVAAISKCHGGIDALATHGTLMSTLCGVAWTHPTKLDRRQSGQIISQLAQSPTTAPLKTRMGILDLVRSSSARSSGSSVIHNDSSLIRDLVREVRYCAHERFRKQTIEASRRSLFNTLVNGTYRWQKIISVGLDRAVEIEEACAGEAYMASICNLVFEVVRGSDDTLLLWNAAVDSGFAGVFEKFGVMESEELRGCVGTFDTVKIFMDGIRIIEGR